MRLLRGRWGSLGGITGDGELIVPKAERGCACAGQRGGGQHGGEAGGGGLHGRDGNDRGQYCGYRHAASREQAAQFFQRALDILAAAKRALV